MLPRILPYVTDFDENVRFFAIDGLGGARSEKIADPLIDALLRPEEESGRIRRTIVEVLERTKAPLGDRADKVARDARPARSPTTSRSTATIVKKKRRPTRRSPSAKPMCGNGVPDATSEGSRVDPDHRVRADRDRPSLRVRLLGHAGVQGAARRGPARSS